MLKTSNDIGRRHDGELEISTSQPPTDTRNFTSGSGFFSASRGAADISDSRQADDLPLVSCQPFRPFFEKCASEILETLQSWIKVNGGLNSQTLQSWVEANGELNSGTRKMYMFFSLLLNPRDQKTLGEVAFIKSVAEFRSACKTEPNPETLPSESLKAKEIIDVIWENILARHPYLSEDDLLLSRTAGFNRFDEPTPYYLYAQQANSSCYFLSIPRQNLLLEVPGMSKPLIMLAKGYEDLLKKFKELTSEVEIMDKLPRPSQWETEKVVFILSAPLAYRQQLQGFVKSRQWDNCVPFIEHILIGPWQSVAPSFNLYRDDWRKTSYNNRTARLKIDSAALATIDFSGVSNSELIPYEQTVISQGVSSLYAHFQSVSPNQLGAVLHPDEDEREWFFVMVKHHGIARILCMCPMGKGGGTAIFLEGTDITSLRGMQLTNPRWAGDSLAKILPVPLDSFYEATWTGIQPPELERKDAISMSNMRQLITMALLGKLEGSVFELLASDDHSQLEQEAPASSAALQL